MSDDKSVEINLDDEDEVRAFLSGLLRNLILHEYRHVQSVLREGGDLGVNAGTIEAHERVMRAAVRAVLERFEEPAREKFLARLESIVELHLLEASDGSRRN